MTGDVVPEWELHNARVFKAIEAHFDRLFALWERLDAMILEADAQLGGHISDWWLEAGEGDWLDDPEDWAVPPDDEDEDGTPAA